MVRTSGGKADIMATYNVCLGHPDEPLTQEDLVMKISQATSYPRSCITIVTKLLRHHNTIPATPLTPLPSAEDFADIFVAEGHSLTRPRVPVHLDVGPELLQLLFDVHSDNCREAYSHAVNNNYTEFSAIIMDVIASVGL